MNRIAALCLSLITLALAPLAHAEVKTHPSAKVEMDVPAGWKVAGQGDLMTIADPKDEVGLMLLVLEASDFQKAVAAIDEKLKTIATDVTWGSPQPRQIKLNGMDAIVNKGTAKVHGKDAEIGVVVAKTPSGKLLLVFGGVDLDKKASHKSEIDGFINSIKPAR